MASANFNSLSAELICLILQSIHSARDLYALLYASSFAYRAFKVQKDLILWHLAQCARVPEVLVLAVTAVKLRNVDSASNGAEKKFTQISAYVADKLLGGHYRPTLPHDFDVVCRSSKAVPTPVGRRIFYPQLLHPGVADSL
jgi:hypothetical protein